MGNVYNMYKVSILVPIFKAEKYIERCAKSLFEQTYPNLEYVFVDDCTPDASVDVLLKVLENYSGRKEQTKIIHNEINRGCAASKNIAIENAKGEFVSFVDADDWIDANAIELLVKRQIETGVDVVWGRMVVHTKENVIIIDEPNYQDKQDWILNYIGADGSDAFLSSSRRIICRKMLKSYNIKSAEGYDYSEDQYFMNQVAYYSNGFSIIKDNVYHYNKVSNESMTGIDYNRKPHVEISNQVIGNLQLIEDFFSDKDRIYYETAVIAKMNFLKEEMNAALRYSSKDKFDMIIEHINSSNPDFWDTIAWKKNIVWRMLHGNYYYRKALPIIKKIIHN